MSDHDKKKTKEVKKVEQNLEGEAAVHATQKVKKPKKSKLEASESAPEMKEEKKKKKKKRSRDEGEETADTSAKPPKKVKKVKKADTPLSSDASDNTAVLGNADSEEEAPPAAADPLAIDNFPLSPEVKAVLRKKGIASLFDIQAQTLSHVLDGKDLLGRARTGCGKTLAFVLPIVEKLKQNGLQLSRGRPPSVIVLAPTRELAKQVFADFDLVSKAFNFQCTCIYGGSPYGPQESALRRGVDVVVGTPGRVKDMIEKKVLKLEKLVFRVLDECDEMLNMGFVDDVELILNAGGAENIQTLLFSATLPGWVKDIQKRFLKKDFKLVDLVGNEKQKRPSVAADCVRNYGAMGRTIVFADTKKDANEMTTSLESFGARALHGDIPQSQRETTLAGFRAGKFRVLVATDVAARGLDISGVELVLQLEPTKDPENYIHRSGRTGRAGCTGISLTLVDKRKEGLVPFIERKAGFKFERVGAPQPQDMARLAGERAVTALKEVQDGVVPWFREAAKQLLQEYTEPEEAMARALATITGQTKLQARSLLTSHEDFVTLMFHSSTEIQKPGLVWAFLKRHISDSVAEEIQRMTLTLDPCTAIFDVPASRAQEFLTACPPPAGTQAETNLAQGVVPPKSYLSMPTKLPELKEREGAAFQVALQKKRKIRTSDSPAPYQGGRFAGGRSGGGFGNRRSSFGRGGGNFGGGRGRGRGGFNGSGRNQRKSF